MSGHTPWTPGPWEADLYRDGAFDIVAEKVMGGALVLASRSRHFTRADEMHANSRLMASAPALVSALEELVAQIDSTRLSQLPSLEDALTAARHALRLARGESK